MKSFIFLFLFAAVEIFPQQIDFNNYFLNKTLRIDYYHTGNKTSDSFSFDELKEEPYWGGPHKNLIDKFNYGENKIVAKDFDSDSIIYSRTYSTLFHEWQTTKEADSTIKTFNETFTMPFPKNKIKLEFYERDNQNKLIKRFGYNVNPKNYFIRKDLEKYPSFKVAGTGTPDTSVDIVIIPDGYTKDEMELFKKDCIKFSNYLFNASPYKENKTKFNIYGVEAPSEESGTDIPGENIWKNTLLNTSFYTFDSERYLMTTENKKLRDVAANVPYDQIYILVNTDKYGGGSIYNLYSVCINNNMYEEYIFTHEFGHGFGFLADEYYTSDVAYKDFYPLNLEPLEPNITTLVDFDSKWKDMVDKDTPIPTPDIRENADKVGVFEGGGYMAKGVYRPMENCTMKSITVNNFCPVCKRALVNMIYFISDK